MRSFRTIFNALVCCALLVGCGDDEVIYSGDVTIRTAADVEAFRVYTHITGSLKVQSESLESFSLGLLEKVDGDVWVWPNTLLTTFRLGSLSKIGGNMLIRENTRLYIFNLNSLNEIGGNLGVAHNPSLPMCRGEDLRDAVGLAHIGGSVEITNNGGSGGC